MRMATTAGAGAGNAGRLHYYQGLLVLKTSKPHKSINFCRLFLWSNIALCPSHGSWSHLGRGCHGRTAKASPCPHGCKELALPALAQSLAGSWRVSEWFGEAPGNFKILSGKGERVLNI